MHADYACYLVDVIIKRHADWIEDMSSKKCKMAFEFLACGLGDKRFVSISFVTQSGLVKVAINPNGRL